MKSAHVGWGSWADFDALVRILVGALDKFNVGPREGSAAGALGPMKVDIVERK
jgi:hypothetical protein